MNLSEDPKSGIIAFLGVIGALLVVVIILWLQAIFYRVEESESRRKLYPGVSEELARLRADQQEKLHSYRWLDEKSGRVSIPIERAMELIVTEEADRGPERDGR